MPQLLIDFLTSPTYTDDTTLLNIYKLVEKAAGRSPDYVQEMSELPVLRYLLAHHCLESALRQHLGLAFPEVPLPARLDEAYFESVTTAFSARDYDKDSEYGVDFLKSLHWICTRGQSACIFPIIVGLDARTTMFAAVVEVVSLPPASSDGLPPTDP